MEDQNDRIDDINPRALQNVKEGDKDEACAGRPTDADQPPKKRRTLIFNADDEVTIVPASTKTMSTRIDEEEASFSIHRLTDDGSIGKSHEDVPEILEAVVTGSKSGDDHEDESSNALSKEEALALLQSLRIVRVSPKKQEVESHWASSEVVEEELSYGDPVPSGSGENLSEPSKVELDEPREEGAFVVRDGKLLNVCHICSYESTVTSNFKRHLLVKHGLVENVKLFPKRKKPRFRKEKGDPEDGNDGDDGEGGKGRQKAKPSAEKSRKREIIFQADRPAVFRVKRTLKPIKKFEL